MPFDEEEVKPSLQSQRIGLKKVTGPSIFDSMPKKPGPEDLKQQVEQFQEKVSSFKVKASKLASDFYKTMGDKTLPQNKNTFQKEIEFELLRDMVKLAQEVNADDKEREGEGSLAWITVLLRTCFGQRDRINLLEYQLSIFEKKLSELDNQKKSE
jgi:hypothetical protein